MRIPRQFDIIKHEKFSDVAVLVEKIFTFRKKWTVKGSWINQGFETTYPMGINAKFEIPLEKLSEWLICENTDAKFIRNEKWSNLSNK
jgi:hypothetical protein